MSTRRRFGEERLYYSPPAMRRQNQQHQQSKLKSAASAPPKRTEPGPSSYLDRFLEKTTPIVGAENFPRTSMRTWRNRGSEFTPFFVLGDLWESFREASAYGVGVPLLCNGSEYIIQYYVPSLSAIQIYMDPADPAGEHRIPGDESDANSSQESSSDRSRECGTTGEANISRGPRNHQNSVSQGYSGSTGRSKPLAESLSQGDDFSDPPGRIIFEYFERELPYHREPLADKMSVLAARFPELKTCISCDLAPSSWISIAWYPIYRIPVGPTLQNVDASFLTFHSLAKPVRSNDGVHDSKLLLPTFGLASYKFKASDWNESTAYETQKINSLARAADSWLRLLRVDHHDFKFFMTHNASWR